MIRNVNELKHIIDYPLFLYIRKFGKFRECAEKKYSRGWNTEND